MSTQSNLTKAQRMAAMQAAHSVMAPDLPLADYIDALGAFHNTHLNQYGRDYFEKRPSEAEQARFPDNSSKLEQAAYHYTGLEGIRALREQGRSPALVMWHHGARDHLAYGLARLFPNASIFMRRSRQLGQLFSYSMIELGGLSLVKIRAQLRSGRPVALYIDGAPLGKTLRTTMLGYPSRISISLMQVLLSSPKAAIIPVSSHYDAPMSVRIHFHANFVPPEDPDEPNRALAEAILECMTQQLRDDAPAQVVPRFLAHRENIVPVEE